MEIGGCSMQLDIFWGGAHQNRVVVFDCIWRIRHNAATRMQQGKKFMISIACPCIQAAVKSDDYCSIFLDFRMRICIPGLVQ